jgi:type II secretory pathway pseudopilin PulG
VNTNHINLVALVGVGVMSILMLSASFALPLQVAKAKQKDQKDHDKITAKQSIIQENRCKENANCLNIICMRNAVCHIGYDSPLILPTPH